MELSTYHYHSTEGLHDVTVLLLGVMTVDQAVEAVGFGWFQVKLSLVIGLGLVCDKFTF